MLAQHKTYNVLHRGKTLLGFPLLPSFALILGCLLTAAVVNVIATIPYLHFVHVINEAVTAVLIVGMAMLWIIERLDFHAFECLRWQLLADFRNGSKGCHHYVPDDESQCQAYPGRVKTLYQKLGNLDSTHQPYPDALVIEDNGTVVVGFSLVGSAYFTASDEAINARSRAFSAMLAELQDERITLRVMHHHGFSTAQPLENAVRVPFEKIIRDKWDEQLAVRPYYENRFVVLLSMNVLTANQQDTQRRARGDSRGLQRLAKKVSTPIIDPEALDIAVNHLRQVQGNMISAASDFSPRPLDGKAIYAWALTPLRGKGDSQPKIDVGDAIYYHPCGCEKAQYASLLSVVGLPDKVIQNAALSGLNALDAEFIFTHAGQAVDNEKIKKTLTWTQNLNQLTLGDKGGDSEELTESSQRAYRGVEHFFSMQHSLLIFADTKAKLTEVTRKASRLLKNAGFVVRADKFFLNTLFFSQVPGSEARLARPLLMTKEVVASMSLPLQSQTNQNRHSHLPSAALILPTLDNNRYYLHCHLTGTGGKLSEPTPGTGIICAPNGSGKTIFQQLLMHALARFGGKSVIFDNDDSQTPNVLASNGIVNRIHPDTGTLSLNPFKMVDSAENRAFLVSWLTRLCLTEGEKRNPDIEKIMSERLDQFMTMTKANPALRTLSAFTTLLGMDFHRQSYLQPLCHQGYNSGSKGDYAFLFDNDTDSLDFTAPVVSFDMTWLLSDTVMPEAFKEAFFSYLFYRLNQFYAADTKLTTVLVEEAHQVFKSAYWQQFLVSDIPRVRKKNVQYFFSTQMPESLLDTAVGTTLATNYATFMALANNGLTQNPKTVDAYKAFGLTDSEINIINAMPVNKHYALIKSKASDVHSEVVSTHASLGEAFSVLQGGKHRAKVFSEVVKTAPSGADIQQVIKRFNHALKKEQAL